jgi:hypothetical protein
MTSLGAKDDNMCVLPIDCEHAKYYDAPAPILDARKKKLTSAIFANAIDVLPRYQSTVSMDSLMFVCYVNTLYEKNTDNPNL